MRIGFFSTALVLAGCGDKTVSVRNAIPEAVITSPATGYAATESEELTLEGYAGDADDDIETLNARWLVNGTEVCAGAPDADGTTNCTFTVAPEHSEIQLIVIDPSGGAGEDSISITVTETGAPEVDITSPEEGETFATGVLVELSGIISDAEDDAEALTAVWTSSLDPDFSLEATVTDTDGSIEDFTAALIAGDHALTLTVTDTSGKQNSDSVVITVVDPNTNAPEVVINSPSEGDTYRVDDTIRLAATLTDVEDDNDTLSAVWTSSGDPDFELIPTPNTEGDVEDFVSLPEGEHALTITVTDSDAQEATASVLINVRPANEAPTCNITAPEEGASDVEGTLVNFEATVEDDDPVDGLTIEWLEDGEVLETSVADETDGSVTFATSELSPGTHNITLQVTDADGDICTDDVVYTVGSPPTVTINRPIEGDRYYAETLIELSGITDDPEDDEEDIVITWATSEEDDLTTLDTTVNSDGSFSSFTELSEGEHALVVTATDTTGLTSEDTVIITVGAPNSDPTCEITSPTTGDTFRVDETFYIVGSAADVDEDADSLSVSFSYSSDDGPVELGTMSPASSGAIEFPVVADTLPEDEPVIITMEVTDGAGASCSENRIVTILPLEAPTVEITSPADDAVFAAGEEIGLAATVGDEEDDASSLDVEWTVDSDDTFRLESTPSDEGTISDTITLEPGEHTLTITVTDSDELVATDTVAITVEAVNLPPTCEFTSPDEGAYAGEGTMVTFAATVGDDESLADVTVAMTSNLDGDLGLETSGVEEDGISHSIDSLSQGRHEITLTVTDADGETGSCEIEYLVDSPPTVSIESPSASDRYYADLPIDLSGTATDEEDADESLYVTWTSSDDGEEIVATVGEDGTFSEPTYLAEGEHELVLTATDSEGLSDEAAVVITVGPANSVPSCELTAPASGTIVRPSESIILTGTASDADEAPDELSVVFSAEETELATTSPDSDGDVIATATAADLSVGDHVITMTVTDELGAECSDTVVIQIGGAPTVAITTPETGDVFNEDDTIAFTGIAQDNEDDDYTLAILWSIEGVDDPLNTDNPSLSGALSFESSPLPIGEHTITLQATDSDDQSSDTTVTITVNDLPGAPGIAFADEHPTSDETLVVNIVTPSEDSDHAADEINYTYEWSREGSETDEVISTGESNELPSSETAAGETWTVTVTASDEYGTGGSATASVTINTGPTCSLIDPEYDELLPPGTVSIAAAAGDVDEDASGLSVAFVSGDRELGETSPDVDGNIAFDATGFDTVGDHTITMTVTDAQDEICEATVDFEIGGAPTAEITAPDTGEVVNLGGTVTFNGEVTDDRDSADELNIVWTSSIDTDAPITAEGDLSFSTSALSAGTHTITLTVTDSDDQVASDTVELRINELPGDPAVTIAPENPTTLQDLVATSTLIDPEYDELTYDHVWSKAGSDDVISTGEGNTLSSDETAPGETWTVTVTASDPYGTGGSSTANVTINTPPDCGFDSPDDGGIVPPGSVNLVANASDVDESSDALTVTFFDADGTLLSTTTPDGGVAELTVGPFDTVGDYTFDLLVTDAQEEECEATVTFKIGSDGVADYLEGTPYDSVAYHSAEMDTANDRVLLYGGQQYHQLSNGLSAYSLTDDSWSNISSVMDPGERMGHASAIDNINNKMYVFGGQMYHHLSDELLVFDTLTNEWSFAETADHTGWRAPPLTGASMVLDEDGQKLHIFGGQGYHGLNNEFWTYDIATDTWDSFGYDSTTGPVAAGMAAGFDAGAAEDGIRPGIVFGGQTYHQLLNTGWCFDATGFSPLTITGIEGATLPPAVGMASTFASNYGGIVAFGGQTYYQLLDDAYLIRMVGDCEVEVRLLTEGADDSPAPPPIVGGAMAWSPADAEAFLVGGQTYYELSDRVTGIAP